jgi:hypothetical protein
MIQRNILRVVVIVLSALIIISLVSAYAASMTMPVPRLTDQTSVITANSLKPPACSAILLTEIIYCPNVPNTIDECVGTDDNELIIGSTAVDDIQGGKGNDCIIGGDGNDKIRGEQGADVCIGGPGNDDTSHPSCEREEP